MSFLDQQIKLYHVIVGSIVTYVSTGLLGLHTGLQDDYNLIRQGVNKAFYNFYKLGIFVDIPFASPLLVRYFFPWSGGVDKAENELGITDLLASVTMGSYENAKFLIEQGADVNIKTAYGATPLFIAIVQKDPKMVSLLLDKGADPEAKVADKELLFYAIASKQPEILMMLVNKIDSIDSNSLAIKPSEEGITLLHVAAIFGFNKLLKTLITHSIAEIDSQTKAGNTALMEASQRCNHKGIKLLIEAGADIYLKNENGHNSVDFAFPKCSQEVQQLFVDVGVDAAAYQSSNVVHQSSEVHSPNDLVPPIFFLDIIF